MEIASNFPKETQKQIEQPISFSDSLNRRYKNQINIPSPYKWQTTKRKKMSSQEVSITVKTGNCESKNEMFFVKQLFDKMFSNS